MLFLLKDCHLELVRHLERGVIEGYIVLESFRNGRLFEDRLPRAFRLASTTIDALFGLDVELIGIFFPGCGELLIFDTNQQFAIHTSITAMTQKLLSRIDSQRNRSPLHRLSVTCPITVSHEGSSPPGSGL